MAILAFSASAFAFSASTFLAAGAAAAFFATVEVVVEDVVVLTVSPRALAGRGPVAAETANADAVKKDNADLLASWNISFCFSAASAD